LRPLHALPEGDLALGRLLGDPVRRLDARRQRVALSRDRVELVVAELLPLPLGAALEQRPIGFDAVPIHGRFLLGRFGGSRAARSLLAGDLDSLLVRSLRFGVTVPAQPAAESLAFSARQALFGRGTILRSGDIGDALLP